MSMFVMGAQEMHKWWRYNSVADSFHSKKLCSRLFSSEVHF